MLINCKLPKHLWPLIIQSNYGFQELRVNKGWCLLRINIAKLYTVCQSNWVLFIFDDGQILSQVSENSGCYNPSHCLCVSLSGAEPKQMLAFWMAVIMDNTAEAAAPLFTPLQAQLISMGPQIGQLSKRSSEIYGSALAQNIITYQRVSRYRGLKSIIHSNLSD